MSAMQFKLHSALWCNGWKGVNLSDEQTPLQATISMHPACSTLLRRSSTPPWLRLTVPPLTFWSLHHNWLLCCSCCKGSILPQIPQKSSMGKGPQSQHS